MEKLSESRCDRNCWAAFVAGALLAFVSGVALAADVVVKTQERGQGMARQRGTECFVITPLHVVKEEVDIEVIASDASVATASTVTTFANDIAVLRVRPGRACQGTRWSSGEKLEAKLANQATGTLRLRLEDGGVRQIPVRIDEIDPIRFIVISPVRQSDQLAKGMSGGSLQVGGETVGMLLSVDTGRGTGRVIRQDYLATLIDRFFVDKGALAAAAERPQILWKWKVGVQSWRNNPQFVGKYLFVGSSGATWNESDPLDGVYAFDIETGSQTWFTRTSIDVNDIAYIEGLIIGGTDAGELFALSAMNGKRVWSVKLDGAVYARPVNTGSGIAVATGKGELYLLDPGTGKVLDRKTLDEGVRAGLVVDKTDLWVATEAGTLYQFWVFGKLDKRSQIRLFYPDNFGKPAPGLKELNAGARRYDALGEGKYSVARFYSAPLVRGEKLIVGFVRQTSYDYPAVAALNQAGGILWYGTDEKQVVSGFGNVRFMPAYYNGLVILGNPYSNRAYALSESTGKTVWQIELGQAMFQHWSAPVVSRDFVYLARHDGFLHKLRAADGTRVWSIFLGLEANAGMSFLAHEQIPGQDVRAEWKPALAKPIFATPTVSGNLVAVGTDEGYLYVIKE